MRLLRMRTFTNNIISDLLYLCVFYITAYINSNIDHNNIEHCKRYKEK